MSNDEAQSTNIVKELYQSRYENNISQRCYRKDKHLGGICQITKDKGYAILTAINHGSNTIRKNGNNLLS